MSAIPALASVPSSKVTILEFVAARRPISVQCKNKSSVSAWKALLQVEATKCRHGPPLESDIRLTIVYLYRSDPLDVDNIIKPIQDALIGIGYVDDINVVDVESHRRPLDGQEYSGELPAMLLRAAAGGSECVYVRVTESKPIEELL